jgi:hypothetical protein
MWIAPDRKRLQRWLVPGFALTVGLVLAAVLVVRGQSGSGLAVLAVLAGYALQLAYRRREAVFALYGSYGGGHRARTHLRAAAMTGDVLVAVVVGFMIVRALRGEPITEFVWLAGVAGGTYLVSIVFFDNAG